MPHIPHLLIATSVYPPDVAGPAVYFATLKDKFEERGWHTEVAVRPTILATLQWVFLEMERHARQGKALSEEEYRIRGSGRYRSASVNDAGGTYCYAGTWTVLAHATPKVLLPIVIARLFRKFGFVIRVGGDFFWERACERGAYFGTLKDFYGPAGILPEGIMSEKEKMLFQFLRFALRRADAVVFTSALLKDIHVSLFGLDKRRVHVITHPVPDWRAPVTGLSGRAQGDAMKIVYAGRFLKLKNLALLIDVFAEARKTFPNATLTLIGEGPEHAALQEKARSCGVESSVIFRTPMNRTLILEELAQSDLAVLPSLSEVSPNLLMDALATGTPILATKENGLFGAVSDAGITWFDPMVREDFLVKLKKLLAPGALEAVRSAMMAHRETRSWETVAQEYEKVLEACRL